jgi:chemotaxis protein methyltransferase CheR
MSDQGAGSERRVLNELRFLVTAISDEIGLKITEKNISVLKTRLLSRALHLGMPDLAAYEVYFKANRSREMLALISLATTHHTYFFREWSHFEYLETWINANLTQLKNQKLRIWSAACSMGQEVYSLAMFLDFQFKDKGITFEIIGTDVDTESVGIADNGVYSWSEIKAIPEDYIKKYFQKGRGPAEGYFAIKNSLKSNVTFSSFNLMNLLSGPENQSLKEFDIIFCRNVFIYFSNETTDALAHALTARLKKSGVMISGLSEPLETLKAKFPSPAASVYVKSETAPARKAASDPTYRVLCIDDSPVIMSLLKKIFSSDSKCTHIEVAENGLIAAEKLKNGKFDLITLDLHMPQMNGVEFLKTVYKANLHPPVVVISDINRSEDQTGQQALALGAKDFVEKPKISEMQNCTEEILMKTRRVRLKGAA